MRDAVIRNCYVLWEVVVRFLITLRACDIFRVWREAGLLGYFSIGLTCCWS